jgi:hypothetical protein
MHRRRIDVQPFGVKQEGVCDMCDRHFADHHDLRRTGLALL